MENDLLASFICPNLITGKTAINLFLFFVLNTHDGNFFWGYGLVPLLLNEATLCNFDATLALSLIT